MRLDRSLITAILLLPLLLPALARGADEGERDKEQVIQPELDRRSPGMPKVHAHDFEVGAFAGTLNVESFGSSLVYGARLGYHITEDFFAEATYARSTVSDENFRTLGIAVFSEEQAQLTYYDLSAGMNLFPGEVFFGRNQARVSYVYVIGGVGVTTFDILTNITFNYGLGLRVQPSDLWSVRLEVRDRMFESDLLGTNKWTHNLEVSLGLSMLF
jgi:outer membrane beta-barrel protein